MSAIDALLRAELRGQSPYGAPQLDVPVRLNTNENPYGPSAALVSDLAAAVADVAGDLNRYPDRDAVGLRTDLAAYLTARDGTPVGAAQVWAANGSNEVMLQLLQAFAGPGRKVLSFLPTYSMYPEYARNTFSEWVVGRRADDFSIDVDAAVATVREHAPAVVLLASPNNPTGTALPLDTVRALLDATHGLVVVDEAYGEFRRAGTQSALALLADQERLVVTRTMSKAFAFAGARVGYLAAAPPIVDAVQLVRLPYHLSSVTQAVARTALRHAGELLSRVDDLRRERDRLVAWLRANGHEAADSDANFVLFGRYADRRAVWEALVEHGVLVREVGPPQWLRVSIGTPAENQAFQHALSSVTSTGTDGLDVQQGEHL